MFGVQLAVNAAWTPVFFGLRSPGGGFVLVALNIAILVTMLLFIPIALAAGLL